MVHKYDRMGVGRPNSEDAHITWQQWTFLMRRIRENLKNLIRVEFDEATGVRRHYFNGKLERTVKVRCDRY